MTGIVLFGIFLILTILNVPIAVSLGVSSIITMIIFDIQLSTVSSIFYASTSSFTLLAIPFFVLTGVLMERTGISERLVSFAQKLTGHFTGGLGIVTVVTACFFAAISGSGPASVAALGAILIPAMTRNGYSLGTSSALVATAGGLGIVIPPSIALIVYGVIAEQSISKLFVAGIIPGILMGLSLIVTIVFIAKKDGVQPLPKVPAKEIWRDFLSASGGLLTPVIILGGIYGGFFTPTEAAVVAVFYSLFVGMFIYKKISLKDLPEIIVDACVTTATVMFIIGMASMFAYIISVQGIARDVSEVILSVTSDTVLILLAFNIILLIAGAFIDAASAMYIFLPIMLPILIELDVNLIAFGIVITVNLAIGLVTPPVGINMFVASGISGVSIREISVKVIPFIIASIIVLLLLTYIPALSLWLPNFLDI